VILLRVGPGYPIKIQSKNVPINEERVNEMMRKRDNEKMGGCENGKMRSAFI